MKFFTLTVQKLSSEQRDRQIDSTEIITYRNRRWQKLSLIWVNVTFIYFGPFHIELSRAFAHFCDTEYYQRNGTIRTRIRCLSITELHSIIEGSNDDYHTIALLAGGHPFFK